MRRFRLDRAIDPTGVSGTGCVAQGVMFTDDNVTDGPCVVRWFGEHKTTTLHASLSSVKAIHLHGGATKIRWEDKCCFACGCEIEGRQSGPGFCVYCGASWGEPVDEKDPSQGRWVPALTIGKPLDPAGGKESE